MEPRLDKPRRKRPQHVIRELKERLASVTAAEQTERRRNTEARLEAWLLEALLLSRLSLTYLMEGGGDEEDGGAAADDGADVPFGGASTSGGTAVTTFPGGSGPAATVDSASAAAAAAAGAGDLASGGCPSFPLLERLQETLDRLIDDVHRTKDGGALPLGLCPRVSTMLAGIMRVREHHFPNAKELYAWWCGWLGEAEAAVFSVAAAPLTEQQGSNTPAADARLLELFHAAAPILGHGLFHPWSQELLTTNMVTGEPGGPGEALWAEWLEAMGLSEQQEALLLRLNQLFESHMAILRSERQHLMAIITSQPSLDITERSDILDALEAVTAWLPICAISTSIVVLCAVITPRQALLMDVLAGPRWVPSLTGLLDAVARREAQRQQALEEQQQ